MGTDWRDRLKELGKELFQSHSDKKKESQSVNRTLQTRRPEKSVEDILKDILPKQTVSADTGAKDVKIETPIKPPPISHKVSTAPPQKQFMAGPSSNQISMPPAPNNALEKNERVTVGLDFGTSFTKVCLRRELGGDDIPIYPVILEKDLSSQPTSPLYPSIVAIQDSKIYFGWEAFARASQGARRFEHLKVCVACNFSDPSVDCVSSEICPFKDGDLSPLNLTTLYIAWVMKESRRQAPAIMNRRQFSYIYNVGVPIKHLDWGRNDRFYQMYRRIFFDAWSISEGVLQGLELRMAFEWLSEVRKMQVPPPEKSFVQVAPESSAAIVSYVNSTESQAGLYSIVDIGAWTTDVSFFRLTDISTHETGVPRLSFYTAEVWRKATNAIDERIVRGLMEYGGINSIKAFSQAEFLYFLRSKRELGDLIGSDIKFKTERGNHDNLEIPYCIVDYARTVVSESVRRSFTLTFKEARKKETIPNNWKGFTLFLTGGGIYETLFQEKICERYGNFEPRVRSDILTFAALEGDENSKIAKRLAVAAGLSYPLAVWPEQLHPSQISDWEGPRTANIPDADDEPG